jgi:hypothetical protein
VDTTGYGGRKLEKSVDVMTNDPKEPVVHLRIVGPVDRFATITPRTLSLRGVSGETLQGSVRIVPEERYPFKVLETYALDGKLRVQLHPDVQDGRASYALRVENLRTEAGAYQDTVRVKTDHPLQPEMDVRVYVYLRAQPSFEKKAN